MKNVRESEGTTLRGGVLHLPWFIPASIPRPDRVYWSSDYIHPRSSRPHDQTRSTAEATWLLRRGCACDRHRPDRPRYLWRTDLCAQGDCAQQLRCDRPGEEGCDLCE